MNSKEIQRTWISDEAEQLLYPTSTVVGSRYDTKFRMKLTNGRIVVRPQRRLDVFIGHSTEDVYYVVTNAEQYRPDIIAKKYYNDAKLYWVLLAANNMKEVFEFESGKNIRIPAYETIYSSGGVMARR